MPELLILRPPPAMRSGDDVLGPKTIAGLTAAGIPARGRELWPAWWAEHLWHSRLPGRRTLFEYGPARWGLARLRKECGESRAVWINGQTTPLDERCAFEKQIVASGKPYIFHLLDDWFENRKLAALARPRVGLASLVVVPTEPLRDRVLAFFPSARVLVLEEPIDIDRVKPLPPPQRATQPFIVWSGHFNSQAELMTALHALDRVHARFPFTLRILSRKPQDAPIFSFPIEWTPYNGAREAEMLSGAVAGIAPLEDTPYARCKGGYKVKTYFAAGIPVVASPVGHHSRTISHGLDGFLATTPAEWEEALSRLLSDAGFQKQMGAAARQSAVQKFSHDVLVPQWADALREALPALDAPSR